MPDFFIRRPIFAWVVALLISLMGLLAIPSLPIAQYPDIAPPVITLRTTYPGASARDTEEAVTAVIEKEINGAPGLMYMSATSSSDGAVEIAATFTQGTDPDILAVGSCAYFGSIQAARPNPTGAVGIRDILTDRTVINVPGCPPIGDVITAVIMYILTFDRAPECDLESRPLMAYGTRIHNNCPRRAHFDAGQFVNVFDDENARGKMTMMQKASYRPFRRKCSAPPTWGAARVPARSRLHHQKPCLIRPGLHRRNRSRPPKKGNMSRVSPTRHCSASRVQPPMLLPCV